MILGQDFHTTGNVAKWGRRLMFEVQWSGAPYTSWIEDPTSPQVRSLDAPLEKGVALVKGGLQTFFDPASSGVEWQEKAKKTWDEVVFDALPPVQRAAIIADNTYTQGEADDVA